MNDYKKILMLHAVDNSTLFLKNFEKEFSDYYVSFDSTNDSVLMAKRLLGDLNPKSLIIFLGHGSSYGLYVPDESHEYEKLFLDVNWGNHFFEDHDVFLLSCRSSEYIEKIFHSNFSLGFGNIISSNEELTIHNNKNDIKKKLSIDEINLFNDIYIKISIKVVKKLISNEICFSSIPRYFKFFINQEINAILLNKNNTNRVELSRMLFEFRNEIALRKNV
ncbi:hypothetical protein [Flavobacterium sharifuzzamanii]|uniref:hypothetical protein n=1 Tax=Flavobacterium sharifuzzamanii TaxID=2211133 RepID=UPI000DAD52F9|nr:hypothetical protein [Flavobacterium sharifuzzamanii]KAF2079428.1 hypothetical protein DMA14_17945 [Flavobacterium sharifuzzamanii]